MTRAEQLPLPRVSTFHYVALCCLCLAIIFLIQLQLGLLLANLLCVAIGALGLISKMRLGPVLLVLFVAGAQLSLQMGWRGQFGERRPQQTVDLADVLLCAAVLGYVTSHYRLQCIWYHLLPLDTRQRTGAPQRVFPWYKRQARMLEEKRPANQITPQEIAWLVATLPMWAVAAQLGWTLLPKNWEPLGIPARLAQLLLLLWLLAVGFLVVGALLDWWKHKHHEPATAQMYLQDQLWRDTRGEQRRVHRWLAWWKLTKKKSGNHDPIPKRGEGHQE